jgi:hypothetical protein
MKARLTDSLLTFDCPACKEAVLIWGDGEPHPAIPFHEVNVGAGGWSFNGDLERPTISPSVRTRYGDQQPYTCHFFVRRGRIEYCADSTHALAGQTVDLPDMEEP